MIVRMFAILLALGMLVISTQPTDLATPDTAALVDEAASELPPAIVVAPPSAAVAQTLTEISLPHRIESPGRRPETDLFRPPRVAAFA